MYSKIEKKVLLKFFTNIDRDVYAATDAMPTSLWAFLEGGYSRSSESMRDRFLTIFKDLANTSDEYESILKELVGNKKQSEAFASVLSRAESFMRKWAVDYGHSSLKDSAVDRLAIENVSIRATKLLEGSSLGAYQEKSTRYMDFSKDNFYIPESEFVGPEEMEILTRAMNLYREVLAAATQYFQSTISRDDFKTEAAWVRTCNAKAFDEARYLLPTCTKTSLGVTMPTRETERWISELLASPEKEIRDLAVQIKEECIKINPGLLKHVEPNSYLVTRNTEIAKALYEKADQKIMPQVGPTFKFNGMPEDFEVNMLISYLAACGIFDPWTLDPEDAYASLHSMIEARGKHDELPKWTAFGDFNFRFHVDIGAFRDIQRHRVGVQQVSDWSPFYGYSVPDFLETEEAKELKEKYVALCNDIILKIGMLYKKDRFTAGYFLILGNNVNVIYSCNFRQLVYFIELRSGASGHYSYRRVAQKMYEAIKDYTSFSKYIRVDMEEYSDRRKAEEIIQEKIQKAKES